MDKKNIRVFFEKKGRSIYISHLDLMRTMQRALKRSELPIWYTEGFNPRIYLNFPLALSLGVEGEREPMDIAIVAEVSFEEIVYRLNSVMPEGLSVISAAYPVHLNKEIGFADYSVMLSGDTNAIRAALESFMAQETINVMKHSKKKGMIEVDIRPHIIINGTEITEDGLRIDIRLPAGNELNLNAVIFTDAFSEYCVAHGTAFELICTKRTNILCADGAEFA